MDVDRHEVLTLETDMREVSEAMLVAIERMQKLRISIQIGIARLHYWRMGGARETVAEP